MTAFDVYLVARDPLVRLGARYLIEANERVRSRIAVDTVAELPAAAGATPNVVVLIDPLPHELQWTSARYATLVMMSRVTADLALATIRKGARAVVTTNAGPTQMRVALDVAAARGLYLCDDVSATQNTGPSRAPGGGRRGGGAERAECPHPRLTQREVETLALIASGFTHARAALRLNVAESTVNSHINRVKAKLDASTKPEMIRKAASLGWWPPGAGSSAEFP